MPVDYALLLEKHSSLKVGEVVRGTLGGEGEKGDELSDGPYFYVPANGFIAARNGPVLEGWGDSCLVIALYNAEEKTGTLIHISSEYICSLEECGALVRDALKKAPALRESRSAALMLDKEADQDFELLNEKWLDFFCRLLKREGVACDPEIVRKGEGKDVYLATASGDLVVKDDRESVICEMRL